MNNIIKLSIGDFVQFGETLALNAGSVEGKVRDGVLVRINKFQSAIVPLNSIWAVNTRNVGDNVLAITF